MQLRTHTPERPLAQLGMINRDFRSRYTHSHWLEPRLTLPHIVVALVVFILVSIVVALAVGIVVALVVGIVVAPAASDRCRSLLSLSLSLSHPEGMVC